MKTINQYISEHMFSGKKVTVKNQQNDCIDLGLPSGTLWCTKNLGANKPEDSGLLFQWARTDGYNNYPHKFFTDDGPEYISTSGHNYNGNETLNKEDDAATIMLSSKYKIPTEGEFQELMDNTYKKYEVINNTEVIHFISKKDKTKYITLPFGISFVYVENKFKRYNQHGYYWTATNRTFYKAYGLHIYNNKTDINSYDKLFGYQIRPIVKQ